MKSCSALWLSAVAVAVVTIAAGEARPDDSFEIIPDVAYGHKAGLAMTFDVIRNKEKSNRAAVMFMMSGGWFSGWVPPEGFVSESVPPGFEFCRELVEKGYALFIVRHGSAPQFKVPDAVSDVRRAVRYVRFHAERFGIDPERIGVCGASAGGHLCLMLGTAADQGNPNGKDDVEKTSDKVAAVVAYFPPVDLRDKTGPNKNFPALEFDPKLAESVSPIAHVSSGDAPTLLIHGDNDRLVKIDNSQRIHQAFKEHDVSTELLVIPGGGHGFDGEKAIVASRALVSWFDSHLADAALDSSTVPAVAPTPLNNGKTALDRYIAQPDPAYSWTLVETKKLPGATLYVVDMKSQSWLRPDEVNRTVWQHWLTVVKPDGVKSGTALLYIGGGDNKRPAPSSADERILTLAMATNTVVAELGMVPNQPLIFHSDGKERYEDDLIAYTWDYFLKTGDERWPARLPMVKSAVRAMDTVQSLLSSNDGGALKVQDFVVAGGSKRGWTTWMTAAVDARVKAIAPIVIDVLNVNLSMQHHYSAYGFWAPAIGDYVRHHIPERRHWPRHTQLMQLEDPFAYRNRFDMPKCIINATGDQFFLPDSSQFYFDELPAEKHLCYVPNADHSLKGTNALDTLIAFQYAIAHDIPRPEFSWSFPNESTIEVKTKTAPKRVLLWSALNPTARDFRVESIGRVYESQDLAEIQPATYKAVVEKPEKGWRAFFVQLEFDIGAPTPLRLTTPVHVVPDKLPFQDVQPPTLEFVP
jgi:PhoPQ-activated pathogenicity-related protein/acetyl esterase/lipase